MFNEQEKQKIQDELNKIIKKTYGMSIKVNENDPKDLNNKFYNMNEVLKYYNSKYKDTDFQNLVSKNIKGLTYENLMKELNHQKDDDKQKDEGKDIVNEEIEKDLRDKVEGSKVSTKNISKEAILNELKEMTKDEKEITQKDIEKIVKAATIKAIYNATLEKYEKNREEIVKHSDIVRRKDGDFALEDRLATENRQYEIYLQKMSKQYKETIPSHKDLHEDKKLVAKEKEIKDKNNIEEKEKEKKREEEIKEIRKLYDEKDAYFEEMAFMSANPSMFDENKFKELQDKVWKVDKKLANMKSSPAVLIENIQRDDRQEEIDVKTFGANGNVQNQPIATTSKENQDKEDVNNKSIENSTSSSLENISSDEEKVIKKYWECKENGDMEGAKRQHEILITMSGSKENIENKVEDMSDDGKKDIQTNSDENSKLKSDMGLDAVNNEEEIVDFDAMDADVERISKESGVNKEQYTTKENPEISEESRAPEHTLSGKRGH